MFYNELELWKISGECPIHGGYVYRAKHNEESIGCPICTVKQLMENDTHEEEKESDIFVK